MFVRNYVGGRLYNEYSIGTNKVTIAFIVDTYSER